MNDEPLNGVDARIRAALHAAVDGLQEQDLRPAELPVGVPDRRVLIRWTAPLLAAAAVIAIVVTTVALSTSPSADHRNQPGDLSPSLSVPTTAATSPSVGTSRTRSQSASHSTPPPANHTSSSKAGSHSSSHHVSSPAPTNCYLDVPCESGAVSAAYEPLWPFSSYVQAHHWQTVDRPAGHEPWHLDAQQTALFFVQNYLGFTDITTVTSADVGDNDAQIGVGYDLPGAGTHTAATLHLVRYAITIGYPIAPWEVVGGTTTDFTIDTPANAADVSSPLTVSGTITGTDENITVAIHSLDGGNYPATPVPAGGDQQPWSSDVSFQAHGAVTLVASTGGHVSAHERFVVIGVNAT